MGEVRELAHELRTAVDVLVDPSRRPRDEVECFLASLPGETRRARWGGASPRIVRAMGLPDVAQRGFAFTAAGTAARLNGALTPELYAALRAEGLGRRSIAVNANDDTLTFVPFRRLPTWLKCWSVVSTGGTSWTRGD
ncbi:hypothetical protein RKD42_005151 [Streptomyces ambofaciens]